MKKKEVVMIGWIDSIGVTNDWEHLSELEPMPPIECLTVGFLIEETPEYKTIACSHGQGGARSSEQVCGLMTIPSVAIKTFDRLAPGDGAPVKEDE